MGVSTDDFYSLKFSEDRLDLWLFAIFSVFCLEELPILGLIRKFTDKFLGKSANPAEDTPIRLTM